MICGCVSDWWIVFIPDGSWRYESAVEGLSVEIIVRDAEDLRGNIMLNLPYDWPGYISDKLREC